MERRGATAQFPECTPAHLLQYLFEIGPAESNGMGLGPISWQSIEAWQRSTGVELDPWECITLRRASAAYSDQCAISVDPNAEQPWQPDSVLEDEESRALNRARVADKFKTLISGSRVQNDSRPA